MRVIQISVAGVCAATPDTAGSYQPEASIQIGLGPDFERRFCASRDLFVAAL